MGHLLRDQYLTGEDPIFGGKLFAWFVARADIVRMIEGHPYPVVLCILDGVP